jgi:hypothetical protein
MILNKLLSSAMLASVGAKLAIAAPTGTTDLVARQQAGR